jgi:hypothetical protein
MVDVTNTEPAENPLVVVEQLLRHLRGYRRDDDFAGLADFLGEEPENHLLAGFILAAADDEEASEPGLLSHAPGLGNFRALKHGEARSPVPRSPPSRQVG